MDKASSPEAVRLVRPGVGDEQRSGILQAAALEFMSRGFAATSIDSVADRLRSTKGKIYHYYRTKADLFLDVQHEAMVINLSRLRPVAETTDTAANRMRNMAREHMTVILEYFPLQTVSMQGIEFWASTVTPRSDFVKNVVELRDAYEELFRSVIEDGVTSGEFRTVNPALAVKAVLGALNWTVMWYRPDGASTRRMDRELIDEYAEFVTHGLIA